MLTPLSLLSLDQGPKWQEPTKQSASEKQRETASILEVVRSIAVRLAQPRTPVVPVRSRA